MKIHTFRILIAEVDNQQKSTTAIIETFQNLFTLEIYLKFTSLFNHCIIMNY